MKADADYTDILKALEDNPGIDMSNAVARKVLEFAIKAHRFSKDTSVELSKVEDEVNQIVSRLRVWRVSFLITLVVAVVATVALLTVVARR